MPTTDAPRSRQGRGTELPGELFERGEAVPQFQGAPDDGAPFTWVCDEFYQVASGGQVRRVGGETIANRTRKPVGEATEVVVVVRGAEVE